MPSTGQFEPLLTGLFEAAWRPRKAVTVLWRRVETIEPDAYTRLVDWVRGSAADAPALWLEAMAINEADIEPVPAVVELNDLLAFGPPTPVDESIELLRDLIWEASDPNSDWLKWRPCRVCGRRWGTLLYEGVLLCPLHATQAELISVLASDMATYDGLVDHTATIERLRDAPPGSMTLELAPRLVSMATNGSNADANGADGHTRPAHSPGNPERDGDARTTSISPSARE